jgi:DNA-binding NarL/FixJ family response regulator
VKNDWLDQLGVSGRQHRRICELLIDGHKPREIANELGLAVRTVKSHLNRLYLQFGIYDGVKIVKLVVMLYRARNRRPTCKSQPTPSHSQSARFV